MSLVASLTKDSLLADVGGRRRGSGLHTDVRTGAQVQVPLFSSVFPRDNPHLPPSPTSV